MARCKVGTVPLLIRIVTLLRQNDGMTLSQIRFRTKSLMCAVKQSLAFLTYLGVVKSVRNGWYKKYYFVPTCLKIVPLIQHEREIKKIKTAHEKELKRAKKYKRYIGELERKLKRTLKRVKHISTLCKPLVVRISKL